MVAVNTGAVLLIVAGGWVLFQLFGGDALGRLGIAGAPTKPGTADLFGQIGANIAGTITPPAALPAPTGAGAPVFV